MQQLSAAQYPDIQPALQKLKGIFLKQPADWLEVDFTHWGSGPADKEKLTCIQAALPRQLAIRFQYSNTRGETAERLVYPLKLSFKAMAWYLSAYCTTRQNYRVFKLSRIQNVAMTDVSFAGLPLAAPPLTIGDGDAPLTELTLLLHPRQAHRVYDEFDPRQITRQADGFFRVQAALPNAEWLYHYLLTFGADLEVLAPPGVRAELSTIAEAVLAKYK
jgi:predicted DNA-binding transcriptional regulator YafY